MIDQDLIVEARQHAGCCLSRARPTFIPKLWTLEDCLPITITQKLWQYVQSCDSLAWQPVEGQEQMPRKKITWHSDSVIEELHLVLESLTPDLCSAFDRDLHFHGISIWQDLAGYTIPWHIDNAVISVAMQIYLFGADQLPGTEFGHDRGILRIPFRHNTGYLLDNSQQDIQHRTPGEVAPLEQRYSLYAVWSLDPKKLADA